MTVPDLDLATAATFILRHEAEIARARLEAAGIRALVIADDEGGLNPGFFAEYGVRVVVRSEQLAEARSVLSGADVDQIVLDVEHVEAFLAHADFCEPFEACGLIAFDAPDNARFVYCLTNADQSRHRFTIDPVEHFHALRHAERNGWEVAGAFHSHPSGPAVPSQTDIESAHAASWVHVLVGDDGAGRREVRAYRIAQGEAHDVAVLVESSR